MTNFFQTLREGLAGLKNLGQILEELAAARALLAQHVELMAKHTDLIASYTETLREIKRQLDSIVSRLHF